MDSILSDEPRITRDEPEPSDSAPEKSAQPEPEAKADEPEQEPQQDAADDDDDEDEGFSPEELRAEGARKALAAERKLRKEEKRRAREASKQAEEYRKQAETYAAQLAAWQRQQQQAPQGQTPPAKPSEEDEFNAFLTQGPQYVRQQAERLVRETEVKFARRSIRQSEAALRAQHEDADEALRTFASMTKQSPQLQQAFAMVVDGVHPTHADPARFAYDYVKAVQRQQEFADPVAYEQRIREKIMAELQGQQQPGAQQSRPPAKSPPKTIASARGSGASVTREWTGPRSIKEIVG